MKVATVVGTRPQFIKAAMVSRVLRERHREVLIHAGQHYDPGMSQIFFTGLKMPVPDYHLRPGADSPGRQLVRMFRGIKEILAREQPDLVLVYGDSRTTLAGSLAASAAGRPLGHVEAGLRSYDLSMPEEFNRVTADRLSMLLFCPSQRAMQNLAGEGFTRWGHSLTQKLDPSIGGVPTLKVIPELQQACPLSAYVCPLSGSPSVNPDGLPRQAAGWIYNVGDATLEALIDILRCDCCVPPPSVKELIEPGEYLLATVHRAANTDDRFRLGSILAGLAGTGVRVVFPLHPRTMKRINEFGLERYLRQPGMTIIEPVGYPEMIWLLKNAARVVTDSGGLQKEAYLLQVPCITLRRETEWVETVERGCNALVDCDPNQIREAASKVFNADWSGFPYGRGEASRLIVQVLEEYFWPG